MSCIFHSAHFREHSIKLFNGDGSKENPYRLVDSRGMGTSKISIAQEPSSWAIAEIEAAKSYALTTDKVLSNYQASITREEFCELAVKLFEVLSGKQAQAAPSHSFIDTSNPEILKAFNLGIVSGVGEGRFAPHSQVTREQIAVMVHRTMTVAKPDMSVPSTPAPYFSDASQIASWAKEAVEDMSSRGIIGGVGENNFAPQGDATREQGIALVKRVYELLR